MKLLAVDILPPEDESDLQFNIIKYGGVTVARFGDDLVLTTTAKYASSVIEYKGRSAGLATYKEEWEENDELKKKRKKETY